MAPKFVQPAFIRRNNPYLRKKLEELGYVNRSHNDFVGNSICTLVNQNPNRDTEYMCFEMDDDFIEVIAPTDNMVNCKENDDLFLALAALREDSDRFQWFSDDNGLWEMTESDLPSRYMQMHGHKASVAEIIKFFNEQ